MFSQLIDFLLRAVTGAVPFTVVPPWSAAVIIRLGHVIGTRGPGLQLHLPWVTQVLHTPVVTQTLRPPRQTVTTKDGKTVVAATVLKFKIDDVRTFTVDLYEARDAMDDVAAGALRVLVKDHTWLELQDIDLDKELTSLIRRMLKRYGIYLEQATLADFGLIRSLRLLLDQQNLQPPN